ncbi:MAG TPA: Vms1/Ankzf1 family peptidyl-tRNA hydrolase [Angustibacter sp.]|nr:Vms1/Ankzf1 family peptidyl-tRNA hydrolase [Angustibacter sp.]
MRLHWLSDVLDHPAPFVTMSLDASRETPSGEQQVDLRVASLERELRNAGASADVVDAAAEAARRPTGRGGAVGKLVVACADGVVLDLTLPVPPVREEAVVGPAPHLLPAVRAMAASTPYLLVQVDRAGADLTFVGPTGGSEHESVEGGHDVLHKIPGGAWSQRRYQSRVEDSWERNADAVAAEVDTVVSRHAPPVVVVTGDERAVGRLRDAVSPHTAERLHVLDGGGRAAGVDEASLAADVEAALVAHRRSVRTDVVGRFEQAEGRQDVAAQGLADVVEALRRAQVDELLLRDDPTSTLTLWVGPEPLQLGSTADEVTALGVDQPQEVRADIALARAVVGSDAGVTLWDVDTDGEVDLTGGVAALLRWSDPSTPHDSARSMPGHGEHSGH